MHYTQFNLQHIPHIGIWGFGKTGKSALSFFAQRGIRCSIYDERPLTDHEQELIHTHQGQYSTYQSREQFLAAHQYVLASPGVDINAYRHLSTFITELDLLYAHTNIPIIAITGSIGKTSTTTVAYRLLAQQFKCLMGGNIGIAMLDLVNNPPPVSADYMVLELSSCQLEHSILFRPQIAIWTNMHPNHLDRHGTMQAYIHAKAQLLTRQLPTDTIIAAFDLQEIVTLYAQTEQICYIAAHDIANTAKKALPATATLIYMTDTHIMRYQNGNEYAIMHSAQLPTTGFTDHWLTMIALAEQLKLTIAPEHLAAAATTITHRLEPVHTCHPGIYINDSKATVPASTLAAVHRYATQRIYLILGGLSKGVDRSDLLRTLSSMNNIKEIVCFGKEADALAQVAGVYGHRASSHQQLSQAVMHIRAQVSDTDVVLFSPAGSSYDLYVDYEARGDHFKQLVQ